MLNKKMILSMVLAFCLAATPPAVSSADAAGNSNRGKKVVTLGANLSSAEQNKMIKYFKADPSKCKVIYVTNAEERAYMSPAAQPYVGDRALSCAYVKPTQKGGIRVHTANLTWVTGSMIANTLTTCGITNCDVIAASPIQCAGTGALTGIMKAYETTTGKQLQPRRKKLACREMDVTARVGNRVGRKRAQRVVTRSKLVCMKKRAKKTKEVTVIVSNTEKELNVALSAQEKKELINLLLAIMQEDYENQDDLIDSIQQQDDELAGDSSEASSSKKEEDVKEDSSDNKEDTEGEDIQDNGGNTEGEDIQDNGENTDGEDIQDNGGDTEGEDIQDNGGDIEGEDIQDNDGDTEGEDIQDNDGDIEGEDIQDNDGDTEGEDIQDNDEDFFDVNENELLSEDQEEVITDDSDHPQDDPVDENGEVIAPGYTLVEEDGVMIAEEDDQFDPEEETIFPSYEDENSGDEDGFIEENEDLYSDPEEGFTEENDTLYSDPEEDGDTGFDDSDIVDESFTLPEDDSEQEENWDEDEESDESNEDVDFENTEDGKPEFIVEDDMIDHEPIDSDDDSEEDEEKDGWLEVEADWSEEDEEQPVPSKPDQDTDGWNNPDDGWNSPDDEWNNPEDGWNNPGDGWDTPDDEWNNPEDNWNNPDDGWDHPENPADNYPDADQFENPMDNYPGEDDFENPMDNYPEEDDFEDPMNQGIQLNTDADCAGAFVRASFGRDNAYEQALQQEGYSADHSVPTLSGDQVDSLAREIEAAVSSNGNNFPQLQSQIERIFGMIGAPSGTIERANLSQQQREDSFYATMEFLEELMGEMGNYDHLRGGNTDMNPAEYGNDNQDSYDRAYENPADSYDTSYDDQDMDYDYSYDDGYGF